MINLLIGILSTTRDGSHRESIGATFLAIEITFGGNNCLAIELVCDLHLERYVQVMFVEYLDVAQLTTNNLDAW